MTAKIIGLGTYVPEQIVTNQDLMQVLDTDEVWIRERTGILERRISLREGTAEMATEAAKRAIADAGISPEDLELILVATSSGDKAFPSAACEVQAAIGASRAAAFDLTAACSGFLYALHIIQGFFRSGMYRNALIIGAETLSRVVDWTDRGSCILFGDGAGAAVVQAGERGVLETLIGSDGTKAGVLSCVARTHENCLTGKRPELGFMQMDGQEVFKFAVKKVPAIVEELLKKTGTDREDVDYFVLHQANIRILESAAKRLGIPMEKIPVNIDRYGNTSAASIPLLLEELRQDGRLQAGKKLLLAGFGAGLSWGAALLEW